MRNNGFLRYRISCASIATNNSALIPPLYVANQKALGVTAEAADTD